jgi:hypothetical protein
MENFFPRVMTILPERHQTVNGKCVPFALFGKSCGPKSCGFPAGASTRFRVAAISMKKEGIISSAEDSDWQLTCFDCTSSSVL